jgi:hypothetical protein
VKRLAVTRALLAGLAATLVAGLVTYGLLPLFHVFLDPIRRAARLVNPDLSRASEVGATGVPLLVGAGLLAAFVFAVLWDWIPPRTRPLSKAIVFGALLTLALRPPLVAIIPLLAYALVLGIAYRPHATPPETPELRAEPPVR